MSLLSIKPIWADITYFEHQIKGIIWMLEKEHIGELAICTNMKHPIILYGGFQCDEMGLGKTIQMTAVLKNHPKKRTLLFAPLAMLTTWSDVLIRAGFNVFVIYNRVWITTTPLNLKRPSVFIANFEKILHMPSLFYGKKTIWDRVVLDESHKIRNFKSEISIRMRKIIAPIRWCMSGTPLVNGFNDIASQLAFIGLPCKKWEIGFTKLMPKIMIHRTMDSLRGIVADAPPIPDIEVHLLPFDNVLEKEFYRAIQSQIKKKLMKRRYRNDSEERMLVLLMRLRQISVHPQVYINAKRRSDNDYSRPDWLISSTKMNALRDIIDEENNKGEYHKYLVFCQFRDEIKLLDKFLLENKIVPCVEMYHGSLSVKERHETLQRAKKAECQVLLCQMASAGVGLNLQEFDRVIFIGPWWTSALMDQAVARSVRMGQSKVVRVIYLKLAEEKTLNIDEFIYKRAEKKRIDLNTLFYGLIDVD